MPQVTLLVAKFGNNLALWGIGCKLLREILCPGIIVKIAINR